MISEKFKLPAPDAANVPYIFYRESVLTAAAAPVQESHQIPFGYAFIMREFRMQKKLAGGGYAEFPDVRIQFSDTASSAFFSDRRVEAGNLTSPIWGGGNNGAQGDQVTSCTRLNNVLPIRDTLIYSLEVSADPAAALTVAVAVIGYLVPMGAGV